MVLHEGLKIAVILGNVHVWKRTCTKVKDMGCVGQFNAEANALLNCSREQTIGADLYLTGINPNDNSIHKAKPCPICARTIIQAGIQNVIMRQSEGADNYIILPAKELQWVLNDDSMNS